MSAAATFPKRVRLLTAEDYRQVFAKPERLFSKSLLILFKSNSLDHPRLGLAISKKQARRAVDRNQIKRVIRESFRSNQEDLTGYDIVVIARNGLVDLSKAELRELLEQQWKRLVKQHEK